ncbi:SdiA-regulated domain-containing protein [Cyclobacterium amurskyense]|uniref:Uncharacterized protein n=1 Tax=Cyclobacterium amurskyense TaxID=320787 RepID=A0A0H4P9C8_9BACT|nr:SdiA-regulated domain-containing protein [Cyclobacterium amurskyense]AKP50759.1 hypothetical protein CA2015_1312 [Cyclobacterium amurskyense]
MMYFSQILTFIIFVNWQCTPGTQKLSTELSPEAYDLDNFQKILLEDDLKEVSGLAWVGENQIWAIEDESSVIYRLAPETGKIQEKQKFAKNNDIEDIAWVKDVAWVLQSDGTLYEVSSPLTKNAKTTKFDFPIEKKRDLEAMVVSEKGDYLYVFCKSCKWDKGTEEASVFRFDLTSKQYESTSFITLERGEIQKHLANKDKAPLEIKPAAVALHPIEKQFYVLSSTDKWLLITDLDFDPIKVYRLNPEIFKQPEGMTFDPEGNMYISNEARGGEPNILVFPYHPIQMKP